MNFRSKFGQSFTKLAQQMDVLYLAEKKCQPLGSQALTDRRTNVQKLKNKDLSFFGVTAILVLQKILKIF